LRVIESPYKKRVPLPGRGKSGGGRILVATKHANRWFLLYGFGKNEQANIDDREFAALQNLAGALRVECRIRDTGTAGLPVVAGDLPGDVDAGLQGRVRSGHDLAVEQRIQ